MSGSFARKPRGLFFWAMLCFGVLLAIGIALLVAGVLTHTVPAPIPPGIPL